MSFLMEFRLLGLVGSSFTFVTLKADGTEVIEPTLLLVVLVTKEHVEMMAGGSGLTGGTIVFNAGTITSFFP